uniref:Uncharacterized protein n=1 Tax=Arundo donax TaxID=35708 RepID=A0A0A9EDF3_ARUDO
MRPRFTARACGNTTPQDTFGDRHKSEQV